VEQTAILSAAQAIQPFLIILFSVRLSRLQITAAHLRVENNEDQEKDP